MQLTHSFRVPVPVDEAWATLRDIERVAPCMPGATIDSVDGEQFTGQVKVKVGPITVTYRGDAEFVDVDDEQHRASIKASGKETKGSGTARATVRAELQPDGDETEVTVHTDLAVTGRPAQFGRGVMADVGGKLIGQFADCLSSRLAGGDLQAEPAAAAVPSAAPPPVAATAPTAAPAPAPPPPAGPGPVPAAGAAATTPPRTEARPPRPEAAEAIDLLDVAGAPLAKRLAPAAGGALALLVLWLLWSRRRARRQVGRLTTRVERLEAKLAQQPGSSTRAGGRHGGGRRHSDKPGRHRQPRR